MVVDGRIEERLRLAGLRVTDQRLAILESLHSSEGHLTAEDLHQRLREQGRRASLATVYRNLARLSEAGLVQASYLGPDHEKEHFEFAKDQSHFHFRCQRCGQVFEFRSDLLEQLKAELEEREGWALSQTCMCFEGICDRCRE